MADYVLVEKSEGVAILTMNRPEQLNAMNHQLEHRAARRGHAHERATTRSGCIVITGAGTRAFSAGGDIHEQREDDRTYTPGGAGRAQRRARRAAATRSAPAPSRPSA